MSWMWIPRRPISPCHQVPEHTSVTYPDVSSVEVLLCRWKYPLMDIETILAPPLPFLLAATVCVVSQAPFKTSFRSQRGGLKASRGMAGSLGVRSVSFLLLLLLLLTKGNPVGRGFVSAHSPLLREVRARSQGRTLKWKPRRDTPVRSVL